MYSKQKKKVDTRPQKYPKNRQKLFAALFRRFQRTPSVQGVPGVFSVCCPEIRDRIRNFGFADTCQTRDSPSAGQLKPRSVSRRRSGGRPSLPKSNLKTSKYKRKTAGWRGNATPTDRLRRERFCLSCADDVRYTCPMGVPELFFSLPTREVMQAIWAVLYSQREKRTTGYSPRWSEEQSREERRRGFARSVCGVVY